MEFHPLKLAAAAGVAAAIGFGGVSLAAAQEDTSTTETPTTEAPATDDDGCDHGDRGDAPADSSADSSSVEATSL